MRVPACELERGSRLLLLEQPSQQAGQHRLAFWHRVEGGEPLMSMAGCASQAAALHPLRDAYIPPQLPSRHLRLRRLMLLCLCQ